MLQEAPKAPLKTPLNKYDNKDLTCWRKHQTQRSVLCVGGETGVYFLSKHQSNISRVTNGSYELIETCIRSAKRLRDAQNGAIGASVINL